MINMFKGQYFFLSNFYPCSIYYDGYLYSSAEQLYQGHKAATSSGLQSIQQCRSGAEAKHQGQQIEMREDWSATKRVFMYSTLLCKFSQNPWLLDGLLETEPHLLVEGNTYHDTYWGECFCDKCENAGDNHLGKLLMRVREVLGTIYIGGGDDLLTRS